MPSKHSVLHALDPASLACACRAAAARARRTRSSPCPRPRAHRATRRVAIRRLACRHRHGRPLRGARTPSPPARVRVGAAAARLVWIQPEPRSVRTTEGVAAPNRVVLVVMDDASPSSAKAWPTRRAPVRFDSTGEPASAVPAYEAAADCFLRELASPSSGSAADRELLRAPRERLPRPRRGAARALPPPPPSGARLSPARCAGGARPAGGAVAGRCPPAPRPSRRRTRGAKPRPRRPTTAGGAGAARAARARARRQGGGGGRGGGRAAAPRRERWLLEGVWDAAGDDLAPGGGAGPAPAAAAAFLGRALPGGGVCPAACSGVDAADARAAGSGRGCARGSRPPRPAARALLLVRCNGVPDHATTSAETGAPLAVVARRRAARATGWRDPNKRGRGAGLHIRRCRSRRRSRRAGRGARCARRRAGRRQGRQQGGGAARGWRRCETPMGPVAVALNGVPIYNQWS